MTIQTDLKGLIDIMRKGTPEELGKAWKERYKMYHTLYKNPTGAKLSPVKKLPDLDDPTLLFDGKTPY